MRITKRSYESCPIIEEFHIQNVLGSCEKRQWVIGARVSLTGLSKDLTYTTLTGGLWDSIDHAQVMVQKLNAAETLEPYLTSKSSSGFTINADIGDYSVVVLATLPNRPLSNSKWAKDYCPYCKNLGFNAILGSSLKDVAVFAGVVYCAGGSIAIKFSDFTATNAPQIGSASPYTGCNYPETANYKEQGSQKPSLVTMMEDDQYQIIITKSNDDYAAVSTPPYPSSIGVGGFTLNGDSNKYYDVLIMGQVNF